MLQIRIANLDDFLRAVEITRVQVSDLTTPLTRIAQDWMRTNKLYFNQSPGVFADLSSGDKNGKGETRGFSQGPKGYKGQKLKRWGFVYPVLRASGNLERSLTVMGDSNNLFEILNKSTMLLGTRVVGRDGANYPFFLNYGTKKMPARPFVMIPKLSVARWIGILQDYVVESWGQPGRAPQPKRAQASSGFTGGLGGPASQSQGNAQGRAGGGGAAGSSGKKRKGKSA